MIDRILVPVDFSPCAERAVKFSIELAKLSGAKLTFLTSFQIPVVTTDITYTYDVELVKKFEEDAKVNLKELEDRFQDLAKLEYSTIADLGYPQEGILEKSRSGEYDLIVMGTKGATGFAGDLLGSITSSVMRKSNTPVIAVPESWEIASIGRIALASDYHSLPDLSKLDVVISILTLFNAELFIVNVKSNVGETTFDEAFEAKKLDNFLTGVSHSFHFITGDNVEEALEEFITEKSIDMIVMLPRDHSFIERLYHKSTTKQVALHTKTPILSLHVED